MIRYAMESMLFLEIESKGGWEHMAKGSKAGYKPCTFRLPPDMVERLDEYSVRTGISKTFVVVQSVLAYLSEHGGDVQAQAAGADSGKV